MKCIEVKESLEAFLDGEIEFSEKEKIGSHLGTCAKCQAEFRTFQTIGDTMKQTLPIVAPKVLDKKILNAFQSHHAEKQPVETVEEQEKAGWFETPRFAFAAAFLLLALVSGFAFQIGRISVSSVQVSDSKIKKDNLPKTNRDETILGNTSESDVAQAVKTKIIEVPVIKERIVRVPVIREKILTRTVYLNRNQKAIRENSTNISKDGNVALDNSVKDGEFLTHIDLKGFQPVSKIDPKITKKEE